MNRHAFGFALFLVLLFIAPEVSLQPFGGRTQPLQVSLGAAGLAVWFLLSASQLPIRTAFHFRPLLYLMLFTCYTLLVSLFSLSFSSILYAMQYSYYILLGSILISAYIRWRHAQGRLDEVYSIFAVVCVLYTAGMIISTFTGPIYPDQVGWTVRHYQDLTMRRGVGFSSSVNLAGGVAAVMAAFAFFVYQLRGGFGILLTGLCLGGLLAAMSRSAFLSFLIALAAWLLLLALRVLLSGRMRTALPAPVPRLVLMTGAITLVLASYFSLNTEAGQVVVKGLYGLGVNPEIAERDVDYRLHNWQYGLAAWQQRPAGAQLFGTGFLTSARTSHVGYVTSHNNYIEMLNDFGLVGLLLFLVPLLMALASLLWQMVRRQADGVAMFCLVGLMILVVHNTTQVFFYSPGMIVLLIFILALAGTTGAGRPVPATQAGGAAPRTRLPAGAAVAAGDRRGPR